MWEWGPQGTDRADQGSLFQLNHEVTLLHTFVPCFLLPQTRDMMLVPTHHTVQQKTERGSDGHKLGKLGGEEISPLPLGCDFLPRERAWCPQITGSESLPISDASESKVGLPIIFPVKKKNTRKILGQWVLTDSRTSDFILLDKRHGSLRFVPHGPRLSRNRMFAAPVMMQSTKSINNRPGDGRSGHQRIRGTLIDRSSATGALEMSPRYYWRWSGWISTSRQILVR